MIKEFSDWLQQCPHLSGQRINANFLGPEAPDWALIEMPATPVLRKYADGTELRQKAMALTAVKDWSPDLLTQLAASGVWEDIASWVAAQNRRRKNLPDLGSGRLCRSVEVTATHSIIATSAQTARYQIQFRITYEQKG